MSEELLRFIRNYSHDFQNHLQVISGFAQLNRTERIREYIGKVSGQLREISKIAVIDPPALSAALLAFQQQVTRYGVPVLVEVQAAASGERPAAPGSEAPLWQAFGELGALMGFLEGSTEPVALQVTRTEEHLICDLDLPPAGGRSVAELEANLVPVNGLLEPLGVRAGVAETGSGLRIRLRFPRREG